MQLRHHLDDRGVSEVLGAILLFGIAIAALVLFQANAVPAANEQVEFSHNQRVQADMLGLDAELSDAGASGAGGTAIVTVGTDYPSRFLFRNPPPVSGSLTTDTSGFTVSNAVAADPETDDFWSGAPQSYQSRELVYRVDYNVYDDAPTTRIAHGVTYDRFDDGDARRIDAGGLIEGRSIQLAGLDGRRNESRVGPVSVPITTRSAPTETVRVTGGSDPVTLTLRTEASADDWRAFLDDELVANGGHVQQVTDGGPGQVALQLEAGITYELELAALTVGSGGSAPPPAYLTTAGPTSGAVTSGEKRDLTVEVRDGFNGPVADVPVTFTATGGDFDGDTTRTVTTDGDGRATVPFTPGSDPTATVTATAPGGTGADGDPLSASYQFTTESGVGQGGDGDLNPGGEDALVLTRAETVNCQSANPNGDSVALTSRNCRVDATFENRGRARSVDRVRVSVYTADQAYGIARQGQGQGSGQLTPRPRPTQWTFEGSAEQNFADGGLPVSRTVSQGATPTYAFAFRLDGESQNYNAIEGDFFVISFRFSDGTTASYLVAPQD
jgi:hypothetical protein